MTFQEKLKFELTLTLGDQSFSIPGGQVKHFSARLANHGFTASVSFWTSLEKADAPLFTAFKTPDLLQVRVSVTGAFPTGSTPAPAPLVVQGLARERRLSGTTHGGLEGEERSFRHYTVEFADAAQVLWRQHRPTELYTQKKLADVLDAHKASLQLTYDWDVLQAELPLFCLALGEDDPRTSFYDFVLWYMHANNGVWTYQSQQDSYVLSGTKSTAGRAATLSRREVDRVQLQVPPVIRHAARVLNGVANGPTTESLEQDQSAQSISHDVLLRTPIPSEAEQRQALEKARLKARRRWLHLTFRQLPTVPVYPGALLRLEGGLWSSAMKGAGEDLRVLTLDLDIRALREGVHDEQQATQAGYAAEVSARLEQKADPVATFPPFRPPRYPIFVEGKVVSPGGEETDRTWFIVEDEKTSVSQYRMTVPMWNKTVHVPAEPNMFPGHYYFPPYKNERVLLALFLERAELHRYLDWAENVRMPQDGQGDQMLLGKNKTSQTGLTHDFQDSKPVWNLLRVNSGDTQTVKISEGAMLLQVKEKPGSVAVTATYDVSPQVEAAKGDLSMSVGGAIGDTTAAYQGAMTNVRGKLEDASAGTMAALETAQAELGAKVAEARSELTGALDALSGKTAQLGAAATDAKAALGKLR